MRLRALVTAAGLGKRFGVLTQRTNKCLFQIDGKPVLSHLMDRFEGVGIRDVTVVTGHQHALLARVLAGRAHVVFNPFYAVSGILGSFWAARRELEGRPFVFTTADHFFHPSVLAGCLSVRGDLVIAVQKKKAYTKEDAKVIIRRSCVSEIGKHLPVDQADGEFGGMAVFSPRASAWFYGALERHLIGGGLSGYMMEVLGSVSREKRVPILPSYCGEDARIEIDSVRDLMEARRLARCFKNLKRRR